MPDATEGDDMTTITDRQGEEVLLDNEDGTGWRVDPDGWAHPTERTPDGWRDTDEQPLPPDPDPHRVGVAIMPVRRPAEAGSR